MRWKSRRSGFGPALCPAALLLACFLTVPRQAGADSSRIPVYQTSTLSASGHYYLTRDITVTTSLGITIAASHVKLDLNGHRILSTYTSSGAVISANGYTDIEISNGQIQGGYFGIYMYSPGGVVRIHDLRITGTAYRSMDLEGTAGNTLQVLLENNIITSSSDTGVYLDYAQGGLVRGNLVTECTNGYFLDYCFGNQVEGNSSISNSATGILLRYAYDNTVRENSVVKNGGASVYPGIELYYSVNNTVDWNFLAENAWYGLYVYEGGGNVYSFNRWPGNGTGAYYVQPVGAAATGGGNCGGGGGCM